MSIKNKLLSFLGLNASPVIRVYNGFGDADEFFIYGHFLTLSARPRKTYSESFFRNMFAVIRLFMIKPGRVETVLLEWQDEVFETVTEADGFFTFRGRTPANLQPGHHKVKLLIPSFRITNVGTVYIPNETQTGFISDVDDTFLISHTGNTRRRLRELFTHNEHNRKAFDGVVNHYQLLAQSGRLSHEPPNPFFYVSSSEWNLYDFIREFALVNKLPPGIFLLGKIKRIRDFLHSGQNNHQTKFNRIERVMKTYQSLKFVLLGDDSQQDPFIYEEVVREFPEKVLAVYIRKVWAVGKNRGRRKKNAPDKRDRVHEAIGNMESCGVNCCYFEHSSEALIHSKKIGLVLE